MYHARELLTDELVLNGTGESTLLGCLSHGAENS